MIITNLCNPSSGRPVINQQVIETDNGDKYFKSYQTIIAKKDAHGEVFLDRKQYSKRYSRTTLRYLVVFLAVRNNKNTIIQHVENWDYTLADLISPLEED